MRRAAEIFGRRRCVGDGMAADGPRYSTYSDAFPETFGHGA